MCSAASGRESHLDRQAINSDVCSAVMAAMYCFNSSLAVISFTSCLRTYVRYGRMISQKQSNKTDYLIYQPDFFYRGAQGTGYADPRGYVRQVQTSFDAADLPVGHTGQPGKLPLADAVVFPIVADPVGWFHRITNPFPDVENV